MIYIDAFISRRSIIENNLTYQQKAKRFNQEQASTKMQDKNKHQD